MNGIDQFILRNAQMGSGSSSMSGSGSATGSSSGAYILEGSTSELRNHVGEQVEVTGHIEGSNSMGGGSGASGSGSMSDASTSGGSTSGSATSGSGMSGSTGSAAGSGARLRVDSVRTMSSTCMGQ